MLPSLRVLFFAPRCYKVAGSCLLGLLALAPLSAQAEPLSVTFVGDVMLDGGPGHVITSGGDPFEPTANLLAADLTIGNLECAIVEDGERQDKPFTFRASQSALPVLAKYFSAVSLANNHSGDWGKVGFVSELSLLRQAHVPWFGGGRNAKEARTPLRLTARGRRVALLGYNDFPPHSFAAGPNYAGTAWLVEKDVVRDLQRLRTEHSADIVLLYLHWGEEFDERPSAEQQRLARVFIDAGASAVLGSHPHVTQTVEWYQGHPIVYSLGNFLFDYYPNDPPEWRGWVARLLFPDSGDISLTLTTVALDAAGVPHPVPQSEVTLLPPKP